MSKELEALATIKEYLTRYNDTDEVRSIDYKNELDIIEKALKNYELMKYTCFIVTDKKISDDDIEKLKNQRMFSVGAEETKIELLFDEETQKKLEALEIIKEKAVNIYYVEITNNSINYNRCIDEFFGNYEHRSIYYLTKEEFVLLKGVLL